MEFGSARELGCYGKLLAAVDQEFIHRRGRVRSLSERYPAVYGPFGQENLFGLFDNGQPVSLLGVRRCSLAIEGGQIPVGFIGGVTTLPQYRGKGYATRLLERVLVTLSRELEALMLWTGTPNFYERVGWQRGNAGVLLSVCVSGDVCGRVSAGAITNHYLSDLAVQGACLRASSVVSRSGEGDVFYNTPLPVESVACLALRDRGALVGYSAYGIWEGQTCVLEIHGTREATAAILAQHLFLERQILLNASSTCELAAWLNIPAQSKIVAGPTAMVKSFNKSLAASLRNVYVPFLDRI